jgi:hypothetical protein
MENPNLATECRPIDTVSTCRHPQKPVLNSIKEKSADLASAVQSPKAVVTIDYKMHDR